MTIIATTPQKTEVQAMGQALNASVNFSGALMEMLATVYAYILMAAIREAVQNACDAARRNGLTFSEGVQVILPTVANPMITIIDQGTGMSREFMESMYLSFGSSTKAADDGSAGGLGVGRWAAYGYIRECFIQTCHAEDMVQRTYFQFQGPNATPQVQLASESPGTHVGTKVFFPVKESDLGEALRAVAWLKDVMQLTTGDSFSVDTPAALPKMLPEFSGTVLDLEIDDPTLKGVRIYPMQGDSLKYGRTGLQKGSLVVLTNAAAGVGGLPFHVQAPGVDSVFESGMVVEIPMSFRVPFMPSREEVKYTDEVNSLLRAIDVAARSALLRVVTKLHAEQSLSSKKKLTDLLGSVEAWHCFCRVARTETSMSKDLREAVGGRNWDGKLRLPAVPEMRDAGLTVKSMGTFETLQTVHSLAGELAVAAGPTSSIAISFSHEKPAVLVLNDVKTGGLARFRSWAKGKPEKTKFVYISHESDVSKAEAAAIALNSAYGGELPVVRTSTMPAFARTVVGSKIVTSKVRSSGGTTYYCCVLRKQLTDMAGIGEPGGAATRRVWIGKDGAKLAGLKEGITLTAIFNCWESSFASVLASQGLTRLYVLSPKQEAELNELVTSLKKDGYWELSEAELKEEEDGELLASVVSSAKSWVPIEDYVREVLLSERVQPVAEGRVMQAVTPNHHFTSLVATLASKPRLGLTGTTIDKAFAPYVDLISGEVKLLERSADDNLLALCRALAQFGGWMAVTTDDTPARQDLSKALVDLGAAGKVNYNDVRQELVGRFPVLGAVRPGILNEPECDDLVRALAVLYP